MGGGEFSPRALAICQNKKLRTFGLSIIRGLSVSVIRRPGSTKPTP